METFKFIIECIVGLIAIYSIVKNFILKYIESVRISDKLHPYFSKYDIKKATDCYIRTNCQNASPLIEHEIKDSVSFSVKNDLLNFFLKNVFKNKHDNNQFHLILGDAGFGKTTFLINLYIKYLKNPFQKKYNVILLPLSQPRIWDELRKIETEKAKNTILLLDGLDEDLKAQEDYVKRLNYILAVSYTHLTLPTTSRV